MSDLVFLLFGGDILREIMMGTLKNLGHSVLENIPMTKHSSKILEPKCNWKGAVFNEIAGLTAISIDLSFVPLVESIGMEGRDMVFSSKSSLSS